MNYWLLLVPVLSALSGWMLVRSLFWFLFRPLGLRRIGGIRLWGIIPGNKVALANGAVKFADTAFQSISAELAQKISDPGAVQKILPLIETHVDDFLRNKLPEQMPMIGMFIGDKTITTMKAIFLKEIESMFPEVIRQYAGDMLSGLDAGKIVRDKIVAISPKSLEELFWKQFRRQVNTITWMAVLFGLLVGLVQLAVAVWAN